MAVGKEAPIPNVCVDSAACRAALETTVAQFTEILASTPMKTIKRRLRDAVIVAPDGFSSDDLVIECCDDKSKEASESL
jgi:hypothetical protein